MGSQTLSTVTPTAEARFRAMGTHVHVLVTGPHSELGVKQARHRIGELEQRWSRFLPDSEIGRLNAAAAWGDPVPLSIDTIALLERAKLAWQSTDGIWNPLMGNALSALGYDRSFSADLVSGHDPEIATAVGLDELEIDHDSSTARLPRGSGLDLGGIAKGFAADLVTNELLGNDSWGAMVNLGGDIRVRGLAPSGLDWAIRVAEPALSERELTVVRLPSGGVATSTTARRRWTGPSGERHHLLDPRTSLPAKSAVVLTTAVAGAAWWAEVAATALTIKPELSLAGCAALQLHANGSVARYGDFEQYER